MKYGVNIAKNFREGSRLWGILLACIVLGYLLLAATYLIPAEKLQPGLEETIKVYDQSTGRAERMDQTLVPGYPSTWLDNTSDSFFLQCAAAVSPDKSIWHQAAYNPYYSTITQSRAGDELVNYVRGDRDDLHEKSMGRYWNGYLIFLKPMLMVMSYQDVRMLNMVTLGAMLMLLLCLMYRRGMQRYLPAFGAAFLCLTPFVLPLNMHFSVVVYITLAGMLVMLLWPSWCREKLGSTALFFLLGIATVYFDMLTYPILSFGFPAVLWLLLCQEEGEKKSLCTLIRIGLAWVAGYALMWAAKWLILALAGYAEEAQFAVDSIARRSNSDEISRLGTIWRNLEVIARKPFKLLAAVGVLGLACLVFTQWKKRVRLAPASVMLVLAMLGVAALPLVWYYLLANTNHTHYFFMHRNLSVTVFAILCLLTRLLRRQDGRSLFSCDNQNLK